MNEYTCDQCHRTHNRSRKCLYCGAGVRHQKPTAAAPITQATPAPRKLIRATQLELPTLSPAPLQAEAAEATT